MSGADQNLDPREIAAAVLRTDREKLLEDMAVSPSEETRKDLLASVRAYDRVISYTTSGTVSVVLPPSSNTPSIPPVRYGGGVEEENPTDAEMIASLPLQDACVQVLEKEQEKAKYAVRRTTKEVLAYLRALNYEFTQKNELNAVQHALTRVEKRTGEVVKVSSAKWTLARMYSAEELEKIRRNSSGYYPHDKKKHSDAVKASIERMRSEGRLVGGRPVISPEVWAYVADLWKDQPKLSPTKIAKEVEKKFGQSISYGTFYKWRDGLKAGKPYPPEWAQHFGVEVDATSPEQPEERLRLVKS